MSHELEFQKLRRGFRASVKSSGLRKDREDAILYLVDLYMSALKKVMEGTR